MSKISIDFLLNEGKSKERKKEYNKEYKKKNKERIKENNKINYKKKIIIIKLENNIMYKIYNI
jgi:hypothetical protein